MAVARIARRQVLSRLRAYLMVLLLVGIPVAGAAGAAVIAASAQPTPQERIRSDLGSAAASVQWLETPVEQTGTGMSFGPSGELPGAIEQVAPERIVDGIDRVIVTSSAWVRIDGSAIPGVQLVVGDLWDPAIAERRPVVEGRQAEAAGEVVLTKPLARQLELGVGDGLTLAEERSEPELGVAGDATVVGIASADFAAVLAAEAFAPQLRAEVARTAYSTTTYLIGDPVDDAEALALNAAGYSVTSASLLLDPPERLREGDLSTTFLTVGLIAVVAFFIAAEIALLAGAAFSVSARRQQRQLAVLAGIGASERQLRSIVAGQGLVLGGFAAVVGTAVGAGLAVAALPLIDESGVIGIWGAHLPWAVLAGIAGLAVVVAWIAASVPARRLARLDAMAALRGATGLARRARRRRPVQAVALLVLGAAGCAAAGLLPMAMQVDGSQPLYAVFMMAMGVSGLLVLIGAILLVAPLLRVLAGALGRMPVSLRLAARDAAVNPARTVPAVAAIMAAVFVAVVSMNLVNATQVGREQYVRAEAPDRVTTFDSAEPWQALDDDAIEAGLRVLAAQPEVRAVAASADAIVAYSYDETGAPQLENDAPQAVAVVPEANRCPIDRIEVFGRALRDAARGDWRCTDNRDSVYAVQATSESGLAVTDEAGLELLLGREPSAVALEAFRSGQAVALYAEYVERGEAVIGWSSPDDQQAGGYLPFGGGVEPTSTSRLPAVLETPATPTFTTLVIAEATAERLGMALGPPTLLALLDEAPTWADTDRIAPLVSAAVGADYWGYFAQDYTGRESNQVATLVIIALVALLALASSAVALALARSEGAADQTTIESVGGTGSQRRGMAFWQGLLIVGLGALLGSAAAFVPTLGLMPAAELPFAPSTAALVVLALGMPLLIAVGSWATSRRSGSLTHRAVLQ